MRDLEWHGMYGTSEYRAWSNIKTRCLNTNNSRYKDYGGRGISFCDRWKYFSAFYEDMGDKPTPKHSLDRIDNDGNYEPDNCRWATATEQSRNTRLRKTNTSGIAGVSKCYTNRWRVQISVNNKRIYIGVTPDFFEACCMRVAAENKYWGNAEQIELLK